MKKLMKAHFFILLIPCVLPAVALAQAIANPLIRPALLTETQNSADAAATEGTKVQGSNGSNTANTEDVRQQAERRITQEDLNMRQQALNSPVVPLGLINLFSNMQVTAHIQGAIVMRKVSNELVQTSAALSAGSAQGGQNSQEAVAAGSQHVSRSTAVIRLRVGQVVNLAGYSVRAKVTGQDVMVDWLSDKGTWINVFFGALESSNGGFAQVPTDSQLQKVDTEAFDYLVPALNTQTFSASGVGNNQQGNSGNFGSPFGGGNQGGGQPGFGSSSPF